MAMVNNVFTFGQYMTSFDVGKNKKKFILPSSLKEEGKKGTKSGREKDFVTIKNFFWGPSMNN